MTNRYYRLPAQFGPPVEFELKPAPGVVSREREKLQFQRLQDRLLQEAGAGTQHTAVQRNLKRAAIEAAAIAWTTPFPLLVWPTLFLERAEAIRFQTERQEEILKRSEVLLEDALC